MHKYNNNWEYNAQKSVIWTWKPNNILIGSRVWLALDHSIATIRNYVLIIVYYLFYYNSQYVCIFPTLPMAVSIECSQ